MRIMMVGNPNAGKTSLFNALTHQQRKVANWSGVTVSSHAAKIYHYPNEYLIDLPGFYSLSPGLHSSMDIEHAIQALMDEPPDLILNVVNVAQLERHLFLSSELLELGIPMMMILTHMDLLEEEQKSIDIQALSQHLGLAVYALPDYREESMHALMRVLYQAPRPAMRCMPWPPSLTQLDFAVHAPGTELFILRRDLEGANIKPQNSINLPAEARDELELTMMDARYQFVHQLVADVMQKSISTSQSITKALDRWFLHRYWGWPIFLLILWVFFSLAVNIGGALQVKLGFISSQFFNILVDKSLNLMNAPLWLKWMLVNGFGQGVTTMIGFLPVMALMNGFLSMMESSGYMARVAFLFERIMRRIGLPGKAFLPLLIGFGCNVPAIMSARMVEGSKERLLTVLLSPFMSCSARLTIYAVFVSLFFPQGGGWVVLSLYLLGVIMAIFTGFILRRFWLSGSSTPLMIELPLYQKPEWSRLYRDVFLRLKLFVVRSGKLVLPFCVILGGIQAGFESGLSVGTSIKAFCWQAWVNVIHPLLAPLGIRSENWPAAIGLLTGTMAKEIVIATLNTLYNHIPELDLSQASLLMLPGKMAIAPLENWTLSTSSILYTAFGDARAAYAYLLFVLLYIPCISTLAIIGQEIGRFWQWFSFIWSLLLAYSISSLFYLTATFFQHPQLTCLWYLGLTLLWGGIYMGFKYWRPHVP